MIRVLNSKIAVIEKRNEILFVLPAAFRSFFLFLTLLDFLFFR